VKTKMLVLISATAVCLTLPLQADSSAGNQRDQDVAAQASDSRSLGELRRADHIIGKEIRDTKGEKIGKVKDLAVDLQNGRIVEVIVATGGTLGMGEHFVAVPPQSFLCESGSKELTFKGDKGKLQTAPEFELSHWSDATEISRVKEDYQRFGAQPYFADYSESSMANPSAAEHGATVLENDKLPRLGFVARASKLMGTAALNAQDEKLARVHDFIVDVPAGRVVEVILSYGGFIGMGNDYSAVPPQAFRWNADDSALTLDTTKEALRAAPHFKGGKWSYATNRDRIGRVYAFYHVEPYFMAGETDQGAENVRERTVTMTPSTTEKNNTADMDISEKIHKSLLSNDNISEDAKKVKIVTADGRVTLIGTVESQDEKRLISEAAAKVAGQDKVDNNQLKVRGISSTPPATEPPLTPPPMSDQGVPK